MRGERCRVVAQIRPLQPGEEEAIGHSIHLPAPGRVLVASSGREFEVDRVFSPHDHDGGSVHSEVASLVSSLYDGFNATVFAYGASGAGKTHTVLGGKHSPGLVDNIIEDVFARYNERTCTVQLSVEELYCERFTDLLAPLEQPPAVAALAGATSATSSFSSTASGGSLSARMRGGVFGGAGASSFSAASSGSRAPLHQPRLAPPGPQRQQYTWHKATLTSAAEMKALVHSVLRKRRTASTCLNDKSSRSHVIVSITLQQQVQQQQGSAHDAGGMSSPLQSCDQDATETCSTAGDDPTMTDEVGSDAGSVAAASVAGVSTYLIGKLYLVDLAGSENIKRSGAEGARQKEAGDINKSLCHLKSVIEDVFKGRRVTTYRNSKLTFRLQDALGGGNSKLLVVACISTAKSDLQETKETLRFAEMARAITNTPVVNREPKDELIHRLQQTVAELQDQLAKGAGGGRAAADELLRQQLHAVEAAYAELREELDVKEARWVSSATSVKDQVGVLHGVLSASQAAEASLRQQLSKERAELADSQLARTSAAQLLGSMAGELADLQGRCGELQQRLGQQAAAAASAVALCVEQQDAALMLQQELQRERAARAAAVQQAQQLRAQLAAASAEAATGTHTLADTCAQLQTVTADMAAQHAHAQQQLTVLAQAVQAAGADRDELDKACVQQRWLIADLQDQQRRQGEQHAAQRAEQQRHLQSVQAQHAAELAAERKQHARALEEAMQSSVRKLAADKLRCKQHLALGVRSLMEDAQSLSRALASRDRLVLLPGSSSGGGSSTQDSPVTPAADLTLCLADAAAPAADGGLLADDAELMPVPHAGAEEQEASHEQRLEPMEGPAASEALHLQQHSAGMSRNPLFDYSLSCDDDDGGNGDSGLTNSAEDAGGSDAGGSSEGSSVAAGTGAGRYGAPPPQQLMAASAAKTAALVAVAAAAAAATASKAAVARRAALSAPSSAAVVVYAETASSSSGGGSSSSAGGGWQQPRGSPLLGLLRGSSANSRPASSSSASEGGRSALGLPPLIRARSRSTSAGGSSGSRFSSGGGTAAAAAVAPAAAVSSRSTSTSPPGAGLPERAAAANAAATAAATAAAATAVAAAAVRSELEQQRQAQQQLVGCGASTWPTRYVCEEEVDMAFSKLRGGAQTVNGLHSFLEHRMLGGNPHSKTLCGRQREPEHVRVQDMMTYHLASCASMASRRSSSSNGGDGVTSSRSRDSPSSSRRTAAAAASLEQRASSAGEQSCRSTTQHHPLSGADAAPAHAAPQCEGAGGASTPVRASLGRLADQEQEHVHAAPSPAAGTPEGSSGGVSRWASWLTPLSRKKHQQQSGVVPGVPADASTSSSRGRAAGRTRPPPPRQPAFEDAVASPKHAEHTSQQQFGSSNSSQQQHQHGMQLTSQQAPRPRVHAREQVRLPHGAQLQGPAAAACASASEEHGGDAAGPRDKQHATAATSVAQHRYGTPPQPPSQAVRLVSGCTGSMVVSQLYVDSPAVKIAPSSSSASASATTMGSASAGARQHAPAHQLRLPLDAPVAHRTRWRQVQLGGAK